MMCDHPRATSAAFARLGTASRDDKRAGSSPACDNHRRKQPQCKMTVLPLNSGKPRTCVTLNGSGIQLAVGPQPLWLRNHNSGPAQRIMITATVILDKLKPHHCISPDKAAQLAHSKQFPSVQLSHVVQLSRTFRSRTSAQIVLTNPDQLSCANSSRALIQIRRNNDQLSPKLTTTNNFHSKLIPRPTHVRSENQEKYRPIVCHHQLAPKLIVPTITAQLSKSAPSAQRTQNISKLNTAYTHTRISQSCSPQSYCPKTARGRNSDQHNEAVQLRTVPLRLDRT
ncbi:hypothetical protein F511_39866 [Dorcoceras hygrometricum]|uniref:Uncharacterized protein n=1 Tax=Dorcoceras hygrometricum TaxID=472368 RepID=A0A2Z7AFQ8_9LAMI|nr:hypothetical protein F511_39866 [Dorcoceras hygrometricum]